VQLPDLPLVPSRSLQMTDLVPCRRKMNGIDQRTVRQLTDKIHIYL
jgi:hypothetical protein